MPTPEPGANMHHDSTTDADQIKQAPGAWVAIPSWVIRDETLTCKAKLAFITLIDFARGDGACFPRVSTIAARMCCSENTVRGALQELTDRGLVAVQQRYRDDGQQRSNLYVLASEPPADRGADPAPTAPQILQAPPADPAPQYIDARYVEQTPNGVCESETPRADVEEVVTALAAHVRTATTREPNVTKQWRRDVRLMLDGPGRSDPEWSVEQLLFVIQWLDSPTRDAQFWSPNVLCPAKLRAQMPKLVAAIRRERQGGNGNGVADRIAGIRAAAAGPRGTLAEQMAAMRATVAP